MDVHHHLRQQRYKIPLLPNGQGDPAMLPPPGVVWLPSSPAPRQGKAGGFQSIKSTLGVSLRPQRGSDTQSFCSIQGVAPPPAASKA